uniref:Coatomer subunit epsilon n=1 Tax=Parascaris equorum TaxID=6256 RepID=A0A914RME7_PAREQ
AEICGETLTEEGLSEDDIEDELSVIRVQKAFVLQRLGRALVHLYSNQREPCRRTIEQINERYGPIQEALLIEAALYLRSKDTQKALAALATAKMSDEIRLAIVQINVHEGKLEEACKALQEIPSELANRPAILQLRVALLLATNQKKVIVFIVGENLNS